ncbi:uncharacterized protein LOC106772557 isoform X1 [Vigna radiata var. radiata]|uniref:Uncharacterized protein LOC106772557 isoform X1 n=1 Tax=Vigna radiata var. radiata TaxID=3916 RepID=A0A1S3V843_VIGRR|nr:uncharacterized protein LOC106772557 isoform X1 [Vigna radiata var. radiata]XP_014514513.1 uncharacterized protein LOC106772557 isoform X1 [Vigna radiata var. radiata]XP_014514514.1 uncharacterized protein LOC106772557 isoform X1 [Vigna radiata var. radiata]XP_014514516.1 uncharacterized protein LOC106772557 isoform X1 [Vigna radiata var. radiata]XP_014514517.1 uncharacterized protein LOC106772557 isoform X1 [Vigna radiata var. radiata]XP_014514518.1 uncharacterized protein LOC106772557 iso
MMEFCAESSHSNGKQILKHSKPADEVKRSSEKAHRNSHSNVKQNFKQTSTFVNHAAIAWHEDRRKWVGDRSQHPPRIAKDQIISWSTSYEELLSTNEPFAEPIPLPVSACTDHDRRRRPSMFSALTSASNPFICRNG